jgi:hypothetical protein
MALDGREVPQLILIQPFGLAFLVVDFNGPAVAADARCRALAKPSGWTSADRVVRQISPAIVDHQALFAKVMMRCVLQ